MLHNSIDRPEAGHAERLLSCSIQAAPDGGLSRIGKATGASPTESRAARVLRFPGTTCGTGVDAVALRNHPLAAKCSGHVPSGRPSDAPRSRTPLPPWRLRRVIAHIDSHLESTVTLADLASVAGLSRMHFAAQFRTATGLRPHEFLLRRRIDHARHLLAEPRTKLVEVALSVGFQTQAHFTTVFKRIVGETPHRWRLAANCNDNHGRPVAERRAAQPATDRDKGNSIIVTMSRYSDLSQRRAG